MGVVGSGWEWFGSGWDVDGGKRLEGLGCVGGWDLAASAMHLLLLSPRLLRPPLLLLHGFHVLVGDISVIANAACAIHGGFFTKIRFPATNATRATT